MGEAIDSLNKHMAQWAKAVDSIWCDYLKETFKQDRISWKTVEAIMQHRGELTRLRKEKWLQKIHRLTGKERSKHGKRPETTEPTGFIYILTNTSTKRCYIGQTSKTIISRLQGHYHDSRVNRNRPIYKYVNKIGWENWIIWELETCATSKLDTREQFWLHQFRRTAVNDPVMWTRKPPKRNVPKENIAERDWTRIEHIREARKEYRKKVHMVLHGEEWKTWNYKTKISLLTMITKAKVEPKTLAAVKRRVIGDLKKNGITIEYRYPIKLVWGERIDRGKIKSWIGNEIRKRHWDEPLREYIIQNLEVTTSREYTLKKLITNRKKTLMSMEPLQCNCNVWNDLQKNMDGHIHVKAEDLPSTHDQLREILIQNKKNTVTFSLREYYGQQASTIQRMIQKYTGEKIQIKKKDLAKLVGVPKTSTLSRKTVADTMEKYQTDFVFLERDKNTNTWTMCCKAHYIEQVKKNFKEDTTHYRPVLEEREEIKKKFEGKARKLKIPENYCRRKWDVGFAYLLPKDKDITRWRPIVSYYNFHTRKMGKLISRVLSVIITQLHGMWKDINLGKTTDFQTELDTKLTLERWKRRCIKGEITFIKTDQKNQFTELDKRVVKQALEAALTDIRRKFGPTAALAKNVSEKYRDKLGFSKGRDFLNISLDQVWNYTTFELETSTFEAAGKLYKQTRGLPMGGYLSAGLACIFSMWCEDRANRYWRHAHPGFMAFRFRDDTVSIIKGRLTTDRIENIRRIWQNVYGNGIEVTLEDYSYESMNFLDYKLTLSKDTIHYEMTNKNNEKKNSIVRFIPAHDPSEPKAKIGMIIGIFKKCLRSTNYVIGKLRALMLHIDEFKSLGYDGKTLKNCLHKCSKDYVIKLASLLT